MVYVLDRASPDAGDPMGSAEAEGPAIAPSVQNEIRAALTDLPPVRFVTTSRDLVGPLEEGSAVKNDGALVTLGTIPYGEDQVEVGASLYIANLAGTWLTYVVESTADGWQVTGTTGPIAVS